MDKTAIKNYAVSARRKLISAVMQKAYDIGVMEDKTLLVTEVQGGFIYKEKSYSKEELLQRNKLIDEIDLRSDGKGYNHGYKIVMEEVAYTWFNRLIALRFMEVNEYLPSNVRILSSINEERLEPDVIRSVESLDFVDMAMVAEFKDDEKLYKYILISQCNALSKILPRMFEAISDYTELLLPDRLYSKDGIIYDLVKGIQADDFKEQVEIIGWIYQYYISEKKDEVFTALKKNIKITKENIPAATQLFTPDWIVKYMVENSLGRLWLEGHHNNGLKFRWEYYIDETEQEKDVKVELDKKREDYKSMKPQDIKVIDPCMGSGHILVYAFDVLMQIYESAGYTYREATKSILVNNLYGLDIDDRAFQLAYFAVMMKARQYNKHIFKDDITCNIYPIQDSNNINRNHLKYFGEDLNDFEKQDALKQIHCLLNSFANGKEFGSIINIESLDWNLLRRFIRETGVMGQISLETLGINNTKEKLLEFIEVGSLMAQKYEVVITNPPYVGSKGFNQVLTQIIQDDFIVCKADLFAVFLCRCKDFCGKFGFVSMVTPTAWMYNPSFAKLRSDLVKNIEIQSLIELGDNAFEAGFGTTMFSFTRSHYFGNYLGKFYDVSSLADKVSFKNLKYYKAKMNFFSENEGDKISYKIAGVFREILLRGDKMSNYGQARAGLQTNDNARFIREWYEVAYKSICFDHVKGSEFRGEKWFPHVKGGTYRKWFGNLTSVVNWENNGKEIKDNATFLYGSYTKRVQSMEYYFCEGLTWSHTTYSQPYAIRYLPEGVISNVEGPAIFGLEKFQNYIFGLLNSVVMDSIFKRITSSIHYLAGEISRFPIIYQENIEIDKLVDKVVKISKDDWNSFERSWGFSKHPVFEYSAKGKIKDSFDYWSEISANRYNEIKASEERINEYFISVYGLKEEVCEKVADENISIRKADLARETKSLISYAVGCMFGRYSIDMEGLVYAGGIFHESNYKNFKTDLDNILPITENDYFDDDIVIRFVEFIKACFGEDNLDENLDFISRALYPNSNDSARGNIRKYFMNDFYKDHVKIYQKKPIYWQFESGKQNGFKALVYLHRYDKNTIAKVRTDYLHPLQRKYENEIKSLEMLTEMEDSTVKEKADSKRLVIDLQKKIDECRSYDQAIAHIAHQAIELDLDDGVTVNYAKFQNIEVPQGDGKAVIRMDLLTKI